jgi:hypothetical protein
MMAVRRAEPAARRQAILIAVAAATLGGLLILAVDRYSTPLRDWILSDPAQMPGRLKLVFTIFAVTASAPLLAFAAYLWSLGGRVVSSRQFPPPGHRVVRDTEVVEGESAVVRGRALKTFAIMLGAVSILFWVGLWTLAGVVRR